MRNEAGKLVLTWEEYHQPWKLVFEEKEKDKKKESK